MSTQQPPPPVRSTLLPPPPPRASSFTCQRAPRTPSNRTRRGSPCPSSRRRSEPSRWRGAAGNACASGPSRSGCFGLVILEEPQRQRFQGLVIHQTRFFYGSSDLDRSHPPSSVTVVGIGEAKKKRQKGLRAVKVKTRIVKSSI